MVSDYYGRDETKEALETVESVIGFSSVSI